MILCGVNYIFLIGIEFCCMSISALIHLVSLSIESPVTAYCPFTGQRILIWISGYGYRVRRTLNLTKIPLRTFPSENSPLKIPLRRFPSENSPPKIPLAKIPLRRFPSAKIPLWAVSPQFPLNFPSQILIN